MARWMSNECRVSQMDAGRKTDKTVLKVRLMRGMVEERTNARTNTATCNADARLNSKTDMPVVMDG